MAVHVRGRRERRLEGIASTLVTGAHGTITVPSAWTVPSSSCASMT